MLLCSSLFRTSKCSPSLRTKNRLTFIFDGEGWEGYPNICPMVFSEIMQNLNKREIHQISVPKVRVEGVRPLVYRSKKLKSGEGPTADCREIIVIIIM
jgi:hypothetical protein